jgi:hypothetical protein
VATSKKAASPCARGLVQSVMQIVAMGPLRDGAFLCKEARTGRQMDQDLHGSMVADVYLTLFSHHWALVTALQLRAGVAVLRSLRITLPTGIMAGSELPHRYVEHVISAQKTSRPFRTLQPLCGTMARLTDFPLQQTQDRTHSSFFLSKTANPLIDSRPCKPGNGGALCKSARTDRRRIRQRSSGLRMRLLTLHFISAFSHGLAEASVLAPVHTVASGGRKIFHHSGGRPLISVALAAGLR